MRGGYQNFKFTLVPLNLKLKRNEYNQKIAHEKLNIAMCLKLFDNQRTGTKRNKNKKRAVKVVYAVS
jgi:hypothetical protein